MSKPTSQRNIKKSSYRILADYFQFHNYQEHICVDDFVDEIIPALAQIEFETLDNRSVEQLCSDIKDMGFEVFDEISSVLNTGVWSNKQIKTLAVFPQDTLLLRDRHHDWIPYWATHHKKDLSKEYTNMCGIMLDCYALTVRRFNENLKVIGRVNKILEKLGVDVEKLHADIEKNHSVFSTSYLPVSLSCISNNSSKENKAMFSALHNPIWLSKAQNVLPPVVIGTLGAFCEVLGWGGSDPSVPVCAVSNRKLREVSCNSLAAVAVEQRYNELRTRAKFLKITDLVQKPLTSKRKM